MSEQMDKLTEILLVEDNPGDVHLIKQALKKVKIRNHLNVVEDGIEAMDFLNRQGKYSEAPRPDLILLDLNLPKKNGREVLADIKENKDLRAIPIVVLSSSMAEQDIVQSYDLYANCYVAKPADLHQFLRAIIVISEFWLTTVRLPSA